MIDELVKLIHSFPGVSNHAWCFNHVAALVAIRVVHQFDVPKGPGDDTDSEAEQELWELAEGLDIEDATTQREWETDEDEDEDDDGIEGWAEERAELSEADREEHDENVRPVRMLLVKVSSSSCNMCANNSPGSCSFTKSCLQWSTQAWYCYRCGLLPSTNWNSMHGRCPVMLGLGGTQPTICWILHWVIVRQLTISLGTSWQTYVGMSLVKMNGWLGSNCVTRWRYKFVLFGFSGTNPSPYDSDLQRHYAFLFTLNS